MFFQYSDQYIFRDVILNMKKILVCYIGIFSLLMNFSFIKTKNKSHYHKIIPENEPVLPD